MGSARENFQIQDSSLNSSPAPRPDESDDSDGPTPKKCIRFDNGIECSADGDKANACCQPMEVSTEKCDPIKMVVMAEEDNDDFAARDYQDELLSLAIKGNSILYLPTGSGKTFIATMLIKSFSYDIEKKFSEGGQRAFFLVNTVALVEQQAVAIRRHTTFKIGQYSGDLNVDLWSKERWAAELEDNSVIVMTAQILLNLVQHSYIRLANIRVIVFDECHRAVKDHPMRSLMKQFKDVPKEEHPHILGLTGSLLNSTIREEEVGNQIRDIEKTFLSRIVTAVDTRMAEKICSFSTDPQEAIVYYNGGTHTSDSLYYKVTSMLDELKKVLREITLEDPLEKPTKPTYNSIPLTDDFKLNKKLCNIIDDIQHHIKLLGLYGGFKGTLAHIIQLERLKRTANSDLLMTAYVSMITVFTAVRKVIEDALKGKTVFEMIEQYSSKKVLKLIEMLENFSESDTGIVFVERRYTCKVLNYILQDLKADKRLGFVKPDFIVGYNNNPFNDTREGLFEKKINKDVLRKFNNSETNLLIASDVLEEGIDVQSCNLVIKFDPPKSLRSYIQSKGRARNRLSKYLIFVDITDTKFQNNFIKYQALEERLKFELYGKFLNRKAPSKDELDKSIFQNILEPYCPLGSSGPKIDGSAPVSLINRYCSLLHVDHFTKLTPYWWKEEITGGGGVIVHLQLPNASPVRDIIVGTPQPNLELAKRSAALKACELLYQRKELDENMLPRGRISEAFQDKDMFPCWEDEQQEKPEEEDGTSSVVRLMPGTKKRKQLYNKKYPDCMNGCRPTEGQVVYMHVVHIRPVYNEPEQTRRRGFYNLLKSENGFAFLATKKWPAVANFPLFMTTGEVEISLKVNEDDLTLKSSEITALFNFQCLIFNEVIRKVHSFMFRDYENKEQAYLIAPIKIESGKTSIDWDVVNSNSELPPIKPMSDEDRKNLLVTEDVYKNSVVIPWYRGLLPTQAYVVTEICKTETALSKFPSDEHGSYLEYFTSKYSTKVKTIMSPDQPLLEVRAISNKMNALRPRGLAKGSSKRKKKEEEEFEETLVAELCVRYRLPAVYWLKSSLLPSIVHRIKRLLLADELRREIAQDLHIGCVDLPAGVKWNAVSVDHLSMRQAEEALIPVVPTAKTVTIKPRSTLGIDTNLYPWGNEQEPLDIERRIDDVKLLDIIFFDDFVTKPLSHTRKGLGLGKTDELIENGPNDENRFIKELKRMTINNAPNLDIFKVLGDLSIGIQQADILQVLTAASAHDVFNLERLETLGDSFLKYSVSLILFMTLPQLTEGQLTTIKGKIIGNRNLFYCGKKRNLGSVMKVVEFNPESDWITPGFCVDRRLQEVMRDVMVNPRFLYDVVLTKEEQMTGRLKDETLQDIQVKLMEWPEDIDVSNHVNASFLTQQLVADKTIADCVEALLGLYIKNCGLDKGFDLLRWLSVMKPDLIQPSIYQQGKVQSPRITEIGCIEFHLHQPAYLEEIIGYKFRDRGFLLQALSHPTYQPNNITPTYQRLEFLGDAILDFLITTHIFETCDMLTPGELTDLRSALVNNITLATISVRIGLHKFLLIRSCKLTEVIDTFVQRQEKRDHEIDDQVLFLLEEEDCNMAEAIEVPKILGDVFESFVAAVFLDSGKCLKTTWAFIYRFMHKEIDLFSRKVPKNHIRLLYEENVHAKFKRCVVIEEFGRVMVPVEINIDNHPKKFYGFGETKVQAKRAAAKMALRHLHS